MSRVEIVTRDGVCPSYLYRPAGSGPWPAVLVFMDGLGIRPAMLEVGGRLAGNGYFVQHLCPTRRPSSGRAGGDHTIETYPARHGWVLRDTPAYSAAAAERPWQTLSALLDATLKA